MLLGIALCSIGVLIKLSVGCWMILLPLSYFLPGSNRTRWWTLNVQSLGLLTIISFLMGEDRARMGFISYRNYTGIKLRKDLHFKIIR
jgi:hypothetical protein